jgi:Zn-dependent peptidase ImmA (M78 family)
MDKVEKILYDLDIKFVEDEQIIRMIGEVLSVLPDEVIEYAVENIIFVAACQDEYGCCLNLNAFYGEDKNRKFIIMLSTEFMNLTDNEKRRVIAHEVGHAFLKHENEHSDLSYENEADEFAAKFGFIKEVLQNKTYPANKDI